MCLTVRKEEETTLNIWKKLLAAIMALLLMACMVPAALATETTAPEETMAAAESSVKLSTRTDLSKLELQLALANGLNEYDYTKQTWSVLEKAVDRGTQILKGIHGQTVVTETAKEIEAAMADLVRMDYSQLETVLGLVYAKIDENPELHDVWSRLDAETTAARPLLVSGDQEAVDEAVEELNALMEELSQQKVVSGEPEVVVQEVEVEVLPTDDFCNIPMHRTWPVLFVISAVLNVALVVVLTYVIMKKRNTTDNTPLVSYDIDDDMDF